MDSTFPGNCHHLFCDCFLELWHVEDVHQLLASDDKNIRFSINKSCTITAFILVVAKHITISEVATLHIHVEWCVLRYLDLALQDIIHQLNFSLQDEVDFVSMIVLDEKNFASKEIHLL